MGYKIIENYKRQEIFNFFSNVSDPFYMVSFEIDITPLYKYVKANGLSFYYSMIFAIHKAINNTQAFLYCLKDGRLALLDKRDPSFTDLRKDEELFYIVTVPFVDDIKEFNEMAKRKSSAQKSFIDMENETDELVYYSCLPEIKLTGLTNEFNRNEELKNDSIPRIAWGKYTTKNSKTTINISMEVNHRFIDGIHIRNFIREFEKGIENL